MNQDTARILIIDDEPAIRHGCSLALGEKMYTVTACAGGVEGQADALENSYDLILLDMKLPDMCGIDILRQLCEKKPEVPIIIMTGFSTVENAVTAMKIGASDYLAKPFTNDQLILSVQKALDHKQLREENISLRKQLYERFDFSNIIGENSAILEIFDRIKKVAPTDTTILITGESGTGKELFAGAIHAHSPRAARQLITLDCSTLSPSLLESELFGHVKGAFTGALQDKQGIFEIANRGTLFLDEVSNLSQETQGKLLRVMESGEYKPVGANHTRQSDVRIVAATNRDLSTMVSEQLFREDLFYRLNVFPVQLPPLRERKDDIPRLAYYFLRAFCKKTGKKIEGFSDEALSTLINHPWPGNIRQLKNSIERLVILTDSTQLGCRHIDDLKDVNRPDSFHVPDTLAELKAYKKDLLEKQFGEIERSFITKAMSASGGNITNAAKKVGMQRSNFSALMKKHRLSVNDQTEQR